jgi:6-phosphogluconolactonase
MELVIDDVVSLRARIGAAFETLIDQPRHCLLSGGSAALIFLGALREAKVDWTNVTFYWGDERAVRVDDPASNFGVARRLLLDLLQQRRGAAGPRAFPMPADHQNLEAAATAYDHLLGHQLNGRPIDLAILGAGEDGHVCALYTGHRALLEEHDRVVAIADAPTSPARRLSVTLPFLLQSRAIWIVAIGPRKLPVLQAAMSRRGHATPLDLVMQRGRQVTIFTDQAVRVQ